MTCNQLQRHGDSVDRAIQYMNALQCPEGMDRQKFEQAKALKARVLRKEVSASMSGIEYLDPEATWLADQLSSIEWD